MTDLRQASTEGLRAQFAANAKLPKNQIADAETFIAHLQQTAKTGETPSPQTLESGKALLKTLETRTEVFAYNATVLAAQESNGHDLDARLKVITSGVEQAENTSARLRQTLETYAR
jgi:hypothetical protein